jgi:D-serine deaminase-like pyridoxal phosphate-dependent protein
VVVTRPGSTLTEIDTPALVVDLEQMDANIAGMANLTCGTGTDLRPHAKTHKIPALAWRQIEAGAVGITCQKLGEAEIMVDAGLDDILVTFPIVGPLKIARLLHLARRAHMTTVVDSLAAARPLSQAAEAQAMTLDTLIEVDVGYRRCGVSADEAPDLARSLVEACPGLRVRGVLAYEGHLYNLAGSGEVAAAATAAYDLLGEVANRLRDLDIPMECVSVGASAAVETAVRHPAITELRAGSYIFNDRAQVMMGGATEDQCALTVLTTVVSAPTRDRAVIDAGAKALTFTTLPGVEGYGCIRNHEDAVLDRLSDEHGMISAPSGGKSFAIGERLQIVPNSGSVVINEFSDLIGVRAGVVECVWAIAARGRMQ